MKFGKTEKYLTETQLISAAKNSRLAAKDLDRYVRQLALGIAASYSSIEYPKARLVRVVLAIFPKALAKYRANNKFKFGTYFSWEARQAINNIVRRKLARKS